MEFNSSNHQSDSEQTQSDSSLFATNHADSGSIAQGMIASDQDILDDLSGVLDQSASAESGCGCSGGCSCGDCRCLSGGDKAADEAPELEELQSSGIGFDNTAIQATIRDLLTAEAGDTEGTRLESLLENVRTIAEQANTNPEEASRTINRLLSPNE